MRTSISSSIRGKVRPKEPAIRTKTAVAHRLARLTKSRISVSQPTATSAVPPRWPRRWPRAGCATENSITTGLSSRSLSIILTMRPPKSATLSFRRATIPTSAPTQVFIRTMRCMLTMWNLFTVPTSMCWRLTAKRGRASIPLRKRSRPTRCPRRLPPCLT